MQYIIPAVKEPMIGGESKLAQHDNSTMEVSRSPNLSFSSYYLCSFGSLDKWFSFSSIFVCVCVCAK